jgi:hypothetical protein
MALKRKVIDAGDTGSQKKSRIGMLLPHGDVDAIC